MTDSNVIYERGKKYDRGKKSDKKIHGKDGA